MPKKKWPIAHIEMYADGRTHLSFENLSAQSAMHDAVIKTTDAIKDGVVEGLGDKLQPGRVYRIEITRLSILRGNIEFNFDRVK